MAPNLPENTLTTPKSFYAREQAAWDAFSSCWADLPDTLLSLPGACGPDWSTKDLLNHIAAWQEAALRVIDDLLAGRWGRLGPNIEKFNQMNYAADRERTAEESKLRLVASRQALLEQLTSLTPEQLLNEFGRQQMGWWAKWATYGHYEQHLAGLQAFRANLPKEG